MDFLDPKKRKQNQIRLFIGYGLMAILIGIISGLLLLQAYGYTYNIRTGDISQNGLLFVDAHPEAATLSLNGNPKGITDQRLVLPQGTYDISLQRAGYHSWEKSIVLKGGVIERFTYPFMFPVDIVSSDVQLFSSQPDFVTQSPDRQWLVVRVPITPDTFEVFNLSQESPTPFRFQLPADIMSAAGAVHSLELVEWSTDNRHFVARHDYEGGFEYLLLDREQPDLSKNISELITEPFTTLRLRDKKFDNYYLHSAESKTLRRFDLGATTGTTVLQNVMAYYSHGDDEILYVTDDGKPTDPTVKLRMVESGQIYTIRELQKSEEYLLEIAQYEGKWYLVAAPSAEEKVYVFRDPIRLLLTTNTKSIVPTAVLRIKGVKSVDFSKNARIISAQSESRIGVFDAENKRTTHFDTGHTLAQGSKFTWMDGHRLTAISGGVQQVFDFDGTNRHTLGTGYDSSQSYFDRDYTAVYTIAPATSVVGRTGLQRTELIVKQN